MTKFSAAQQSQLAQIGAFLREHREKQGKSLEDIAIRTYIRPQLLSGIEVGNPDLLPEPIFVQGFIRRYAETLGLKGKEISQQFTVTSIPSTPRPAPRPEQTESSTTRLTRRAAATSRPQPVTADSPVDGALFSAGSLSPLEEPSPNSTAVSTPEKAESIAEKSLVQQEPTVAQPAEIPLIVDDAVSNDVTNDATSEAALTEAAVDTAGMDDGAIAPPSLTIDTADTASTEASLQEGLTLGIPQVDASSDVPNLIPTSAQTTSSTPHPATPQFKDDLPAFTTEVTKTTPGTTSRPVYANEPVGVEIGSDGPNLKPFAIGAVIIAALTAGVVLLANVLGGDRTSVADAPTPDIEQIEEPPVVEPEELPPVPETAPAISNEPIYVEATATSEAWVSIIADGNNIFEGTLQAGDTQLWEAKENLNVYAGDAGALQLAANGGEPEVMGESGQPQEEIFTAP